MFDWILVYLVVFFFVGLFQFMIGFFDPPEKEKDSITTKKMSGSKEKSE